MTETTAVRADFSDHVQGFSWQGSALHVDNAEALGKIRRKNFSASAKGDVSTCPAMFAAKSVLPRTMGPLDPAPLGNVAHTALEHFYDLAPAERTRDRLLELTDKAAREHVASFADAEELHGEVWAQVSVWVQGIFDLEDPTEVDVYATEQEFKGGVVITNPATGEPARDEDGNPLRTEPVRLSNGVPFVGYLDRTDRVFPGRDDRLDIKDYKTGAKVSRPSPMFGDQYGDQMRLYRDVIEHSTDATVDQAVLLWPRQGKKVLADISDAAVKATLNDFKREYDNMNAYSDAGAYPTKPGNLCAWCPLANSCPVANIKSAKAVDQATRQPGGSAEGAPVSLGIPTVAPSAPSPRISQAETKESTMSTSGVTPAPFPNNKWAAMAAVRIADSAQVHLTIHGQDATDFTMIRAFARVLGNIVERVAREAFLGGFDWAFDSASRAEYTVESSIKGNPAPFGEDEAAWRSWEDRIVKLAVYKLHAGVALLNIDNSEDIVAGARGHLVKHSRVVDA